MAKLNSVLGDAVAWRELDGEFVLISVETTHYYSLNSTGSEVWRVLLEGPQTVDSIAAPLAARHGVDRDAVHAQVAALLAALASEGLIRVDEGDEPRSAAPVSGPNGHGVYEAPSLSKYDALERLILSGE
jgi:hypothetical protein